MSNKKVLESLEQNIEGVEQLVYFIQYNEELTADELMIDIEIDRFKGYEHCLAIMLLAADDPVINRTRKRLFLQWFGEEMKKTGEGQTIDRIAQILNEEHHNFETRRNRLKELDQQNKL